MFERMREVERDKAERQAAFRRVGEFLLHRGTESGSPCEMVEKPWSAVVMMSVVSSRPRSDSACADAGEIVVGVLDRRQRGRAVDAGHQRVEAVALIVLGAVRIARPEHQQERLVALLEHRQHGLRRNGREVILLDDVGDRRAGGGHIAGNAVGAAAGRRDRKARRLQPLRQIGRQRNALGRAGGVVDDDGLLAGAFGRVEDQHRADLADRGGAVALVAGKLQDRRLVEIIAAEMLVDVAEHDIVFQKRRRSAAGARHRKAGIDRVREIAGIAELVAGRHAGRVGGGEGREQRMAVAQADAVARDRGHGRGRRVVHHARAQAVGDEQDHIMRRSGRRLGEGGGRHAGHQRGRQGEVAGMPYREDVTVAWTAPGKGRVGRSSFGRGT